MKSCRYQKRSYRRWAVGSALSGCRVAVEETDLYISSDAPVDRDYCRDRIGVYRRQLKAYIGRDERFLTSLEPVAVERTAPALVRDMAAAARAADVGPMAAVAGAIADYIGGDLLKAGGKEVIVENGGDIFVKTARPVSVAVYAGASSLTGAIQLRIERAGQPCGICTSSGTVGHSLSFGTADAVTIIARTATLADAVATATCNRVRSKKDFSRAVDFARAIRGVTGVLIILKDDCASWGNIVFTPAASMK